MTIMRDCHFLILTIFAANLAVSSGIHFDQSGNALEAKSQTPFPLKLGSLELAGVSVRVKQILFVGVQVYSVGLYVDSKSSELQPFKGKTDVTSSPSIYKTLLKDSSLSQAIRLVMVRTVTGEQLGSALSEAIESRLNKAGAKDSKGAFEKFKGMFTMPELKSGTEIIFRWKKGGHLSTSVNGKYLGSITYTPLCVALFDVYLGDEAVVDRKSLTSRIEELIALS